MNRILFTFLSIILPISSWAGYGGNIGTSDNRRYSSLDDPEYWGIVRFNIGKSACTGGFVSENIVITNRHCAVHCSQKKCSIDFFDGSKMHNAVPVKLMATPQSSETLNGQDWAFFHSDVKNPQFKSITPQTTFGRVSRGGFGVLRIISDDEIPYLRQIIANITKRYGAECKQQGSRQYIPCINRHINQELKNQGLEPLLEDSKNFKVQDCNILQKHPQSPKMVKTNCDSSGGDSGAPLLRGNSLVALNNSGPQNILNQDNNNGANALNTNNFYSILKQLIQMSSSQPTPSQPTPSQPAPSQPTPSQPTPSQPAPSQPTPSQPTPSQPTPSQPTPSQPTQNQLTITQTMLSEYMSNFQCE